MVDKISLLAQHKPVLYERLCKVAKWRQAGVTLVLECVQSPTNLGAIIRSCDGLGVASVRYLPTERQAQEGRLVFRSSVSASDWVDWQEIDGLKGYFDRLKGEGVTLFATSPDPAGVDLHEVDFADYEKIALVVGSESQGLSEEAMGRADVRLRIPMRGMVQSLNVSVATAIILSQVCQQRQDPRFLLDQQGQRALIAHWATKVLDKKHFIK